MSVVGCSVLEGGMIMTCVDGRRTAPLVSKSRASGLSGLAAMLAVFWAGSAQAACPLPLGSTVLHEWTVTVGPAAGGIEVTPGTAEAFSLPAGCLASELRIRVEWDDAGSDIDLYVTLPDGSERSSASDQSQGAFEEVLVVDAMAGSYGARAAGWLNSPTEVRGLATAVLVDDDGNGGGGGDDGEYVGVPSAPDQPRVIVADIDSAINPYHDLFYTGGPLYGSEAPSSVTQEVLELLGVPPQNVVTLTRTGNFANDVAADQAFWDSVVPGQLYHFRGTNIIATSFVGAGLPPLIPTTDKSAHGLGTASSVLNANPDAILLFVETEGALGSDESHDFAFLHPEVDIVTTSYGVSIPYTGFPLPETRAFHDTYKAVVEMGKLHFSSGGNAPGLTPLRAGAGPWWSIGVGGIEEGSSEGDTTLSGVFPDFVSDFTQSLPYCMDCESEIDEFVAGTSFSTPRAAGVASKVLLRARTLLGHTGGIAEVDGKPLMAAGKGYAVSNWFLRRALEQAAWIPGIDEYDPIEGVFDLGGLPINPLAPWLQIGWGDVTGAEEKEVVAKALGHLNLGTTLNAKDTGYCDFQTLIIEERKLYWDSVAPFLPDLLGGDQTGTTPETDPFIFCDSTLGVPTPNDPGGQPQDTDGDSVVDGIDNCPADANPAQTDTDGDGLGDACDPADTDPDAFDFTDRAVTRQQAVYSNWVRITGIDSPATLTLSGHPSARFIVNGGAMQAGSTTVRSGDRVRLRLVSSPTLGSREAIVTIGTVSDVWTVITEAVDTAPDAFDFVDQTVSGQQAVYSNVIRITGINTPTTLTLSGHSSARFVVNGGSMQSGSATVQSGDTVRLRMVASPTAASRSATVDIGGVTDDWVVSTAP